MKKSVDKDNSSKKSYRSYRKERTDKEQKKTRGSKNKKKLNTKNIKKSSKEIRINKLREKEEKRKLKKEKKIERLLKKNEEKINRAKIRKNVIKSITSDSFLIAGGVILTVLLLTLVTYNQSTIATIKYSINQKKEDIHGLDNEIKVEMIKIDESGRSDIIEKRAAEELGMQYREQNQVEYITVE